MKTDDFEVMVKMLSDETLKRFAAVIREEEYQRWRAQLKDFWSGEQQLDLFTSFTSNDLIRTKTRSKPTVVRRKLS